MSIPATPEPIIELLAYQRADVESDARFNWSCWSRQVGKSFSKSLRRLLRGIARRRNQILLSAGMRQSKELMEKVKMHARGLGMALSALEGEPIGYAEEGGRRFEIRSLEVRIPNGARIIALPANPDTARGYTGDLLFDEFAMHHCDREIWAALFPAVTRGNGEVDVCSTPKGKSNMFAALANNDMFRRSTVTIFDAVRDGLKVDPDELRRALGDDELWQQEFLCEFLDEATAFLTYEMITACEDHTLALPITIEGGDEVLARAAAFIEAITGAGAGEFYVGVDIGRHHDLTCLWLLDRVGLELITRSVVELRKVPFRAQWELLRSALSARGVRHCAIDSSGLGMMMAEYAVGEFGDWRVDAVTFTAQAKEMLAGQLRNKVQDAHIRIPSCHAVRNDWHSIQKSVTTGGNIRYRADRTPDGHADRFWAAALAVDAAADPVGPQEYVGSTRKLTFAREGGGIW